MSEYDRLVQIGLSFQCTEDWETMPHSERGRFCSTCDKCVIDLSIHSNDEAKALIKNSETSSPCVRLTRMRDGNILHIEDISYLAGVTALLSTLVCMMSILFTTYIAPDILPSIPSAIAEQESDKNTTDTQHQESCCDRDDFFDGYDTGVEEGYDSGYEAGYQAALEDSFSTPTANDYDSTEPYRLFVFALFTIIVDLLLGVAGLALIYGSLFLFAMALATWYVTRKRSYLRSSIALFIVSVFLACLRIFASSLFDTDFTGMP